MSSVISISGSEFATQVLESDLPVVVDFYADWCPPCRRLGPILDSLAGEFAGKVKFVKINSDQETALAERYNVTALPTVVFMDGGQIVGQFAGLPQEEVLRSELTKWAESTSSLTKR